MILLLAGTARAQDPVVCYDAINITSLLDPDVINASYCLGVMRWQISTATALNYQALDRKAVAYYKSFYEYYKSDKDMLGKQAGADCLGLGQYVSCAAAYPACNSTIAEIGKICGWLCNLVAVRCPNLNQSAFCAESRQAEDNCSFSPLLLAAVLLLALV